MHCQLEDTISIWKQSYPASTFKEEDREMKPRPASVGSKQISSPSRMFSYKRESNVATESSGPPSENGQGCQAPCPPQQMGFSIADLPFGHVLLTSDGPMDNDTGDPYKKMIHQCKGDLSLLATIVFVTLHTMLSHGCAIGGLIIDEEDDSQTASLTLTGQMVIVPPEEADFAKKALFSR
ncbi:protein CREG2-like [Xenopus laevis]|uniref:Protein CREG2-like n=1 Tax=Xenopus laevis TaxID=8355 RepID=A0A8J1MGL9_XENLA|nr:protein CREG2-like [Xenopus laevis]